MSSPKSHRHIHGAGGLKFDLVELRKRYADCVRFEHLPELKANREFYERILDEVDGKNYESLYHSTTKSVTLRDTEIDRLQRVIYNMLPHNEAVEKINAAPRAFARNVIRENEMNELKQKLDAARIVRDKLITQKKSEYVVDWAYRIVSAQGSVDQAKKALYIQTRKDHLNPHKFGSEVKHKDI